MFWTNLTDGGLGAVALDNFRAIPGPCKFLDGCDFEGGMCDFNQTLENKPNWYLQQGLDHIPKTPSVDHTTNTKEGNVSYIDLDV